MGKQKITQLVAMAKVDSEAMLKLIERFEPLIKQYCQKLFFMETDDARQELSVAMIEAVNRISDCSTEGGCILYITNALKYKYISLCKRNIAKGNIEEQCETVLIENIPSQCNIYKDVEFMLDLENELYELSKKKRRIMSYVLQGYTDCQIAEIMLLSRQYINRIRREVSKLLDI